MDIERINTSAVLSGVCTILESENLTRRVARLLDMEEPESALNIFLISVAMHAQEQNNIFTQGVQNLSGDSETDSELIKTCTTQAKEVLNKPTASYLNTLVNSNLNLNSIVEAIRLLDQV